MCSQYNMYMGMDVHMGTLYTCTYVSHWAEDTESYSFWRGSLPDFRDRLAANKSQ